MWDKEDMENHSRRNNVRFVGFPEGKEGGDMLRFLEELLPNLLNIEGRREIEWAHRFTGQRPTPGDRPRPILARFLRLLDQDVVLQAMRNKGKLRRGNTTFTTTQMKHNKFKESAMLLGTRPASLTD